MANIGQKFLDLIFRVEAKDAKKQIDQVNEGLSDVGKKGNVAQAGLTKMGNGFKFVGGSIKAAGIGLLVGLIGQLTGGFQNNQKVADSFGRLMIKIKPAFDKLSDVIAVAAEGLEFLVEAFMTGLGVIGKFIGVTKGASSSTADLAHEIVNLRNETKLMNAELALTQLEYQREAELQRQIRDDTSKTIEERITANEELGRILSEQAEQEREMALVALDLAEKELSLDRDNIDLQVAVIDAKVKLGEIDERITGQRSEQLTNLNSLEQERVEIQKEASETIQESLAKEKEAYDEIIDAMRQHIEIADKDLTLQDKLNNAQEKYNEAKLYLEGLTQDELKGNKQSIIDSKNIIKQKEEENEAIQNQINLLEEEDANRLEFKDAHQIYSQDVLDLYDDMYDGLSDKQKRMMNVYASREDFANADSMDKLRTHVDAVIAFRHDMEEGLSNIRRGHAVTREDMTESEFRSDIHYLKQFENAFREHSTNMSQLTEAQNESEIFHHELSLKNNEKMMEENREIIKQHEQIILEEEEELRIKKEEAELAYQQAEKELREQSLATVLEFRKDEQEKEIDSITAQYDYIIGLTEEDSIHRIQLEEEKEKKIQEVRDRYAQEAEDKAKAFTQRMFDIAQGLVNKQIKLEDYKTQKQQEFMDMGVALTEKGTAEYKTLAVASTIMSTRAGATQAFDDPLLPTPLKFIQAGLIIATGLSNLKAILQTKVPGGGGGGISDTMSEGVEPGGVPTITGALGESDSPPIQAYVVESDISDAQALQNDIDIQATL